jgi:hypothetical protein
MPFTVVSRWWNGAAEITTYRIEEIRNKIWQREGLVLVLGEDPLRAGGASGACAHSPGSGGPPRVRVQQQRDVALPEVRERRGGAPHLEAVVDLQVEVVPRVADDGDRRHHPVDVLHQGLARVERDEPERTLGTEEQQGRSHG